MNRLTQTFKNMKSWNLETLSSIKQTMFIVIIVILIGGYWYLNLKKLSMAMLIVAIIFLGYILFLEKQKSESNGSASSTSKSDGFPPVSSEVVGEIPVNPMSELVTLPKKPFSSFQRL